MWHIERNNPGNEVNTMGGFKDVFQRIELKYLMDDVNMLESYPINNILLAKKILKI